MNVSIRPTEPKDAEGLRDLFLQPKAMRETLHLPHTTLAFWQERLHNIPVGVSPFTMTTMGWALAAC
jgi:putative acetyltransferase